MRIKKTSQVPAKSGTVRAGYNSQSAYIPLHDKKYFSPRISCANVSRKKACNLIPASVCVGTALVAYVHRE